MNATGTPAEKIRMMKASMCCLVFGLLGLLVPVIGVPFAFAALWWAGQGRLYEKRIWNPARPQRILGFACAVMGAFVWTAVDAVIVYNIWNSYTGD